MTSEHDDRVQRLLRTLESLPPARREETLAEACGDDATLRDTVASLLRSGARTGGAPTPATIPTAADRDLSLNFGDDELPAHNEHPGVQIGPYRLTEPIGEGGFGSVWLAEQSEPIRRRVALKLIKLGMDTKQVIARFEQERQALAMMDHPNIAQVLDAGTTETGRPYFVMEYIAGVPLIKYCDAQRLDTAARLRLFVPICQAIQHAHQKGVIHRDFKPSNILVAVHDGVAIPKVIDFGIAKATGGGPGEKTFVTLLGQFIGTPAYMSPEQADMSSLDIDTRSDIYSLGVVLYEMRTGSTPFDVYDLLKQGSAEMLRILREEEPRKPSTRVSTREEGGAEAAERRHSSSPERLSLLLRGDLDWIVMKCLEKDRARRYDTAAGLAMDIRRHLANEPVSARPPSNADRLRKFVRRNRAQTVAALAVVLMLVLGIVGTTAAKVRADAETARANDATEKAERSRAADSAAKLAADENEKQAVAAESRAGTAKAEMMRARTRAETIRDFVTKALMAGDTDTVGGAVDATVVGAMDRAIVDIESGRFDADPEIGAGLRNTIGLIFSNHGRHREAEAVASKALEIQERIHSGDHRSLVVTLNNLAHIRAFAGRLDAAEPLFVRALEMSRRLHPGDHADLAKSIGNLGFLRQAEGRNAEAEALLSEALEMDDRIGSIDEPTKAIRLDNLGKARQGLGRMKEAEAALARSLEMRRRLYPSDHPDLAKGMSNLAHLLWATNRSAEAEPLFMEALEMNRRLYPGGHASIVNGLSNLSVVRQNLGRMAESEASAVEALEMTRRLQPGDAPDVARALIQLARVKRALGGFAEAEPLFIQALEMRERILPEDHPELLESMVGLAAVSSSLGKYEQAAELLKDALEIQEEKLGRAHPDTLHIIGNLGTVYKDLGRPTEGIPLIEEAYAAAKRYPALTGFGSPLLDAYVKAADPNRPGDTARIVALMQDRINAFSDRSERKYPGDVLMGRALAKEIRAAAHAALPKAGEELADVLSRSGFLLLRLGAAADAESPLREALAIREKTLSDHWSTFDGKSLLGAALLGQNRLAEAEPLLLDGYRGMQERTATIPTDEALRVPWAVERIARLYEAKGDAAEAAAWRRKLAVESGPATKPTSGGAK